MYEQLAERNGWDYALQDGRPYFQKNGKYAVPDETTSEEDKLLLAGIIAEGSKELAQLIILCWDNGITIGGPCSGIREAHNEPPFYLHFAMSGTEEFILPLHEQLKEMLPGMCRDPYKAQDGTYKYNIAYVLDGKELSTEESDKIFKVIREQVEQELHKEKEKGANYEH